MPTATKIIPCLWFDSDRDRRERVMTAMLQMKKLDVAALERAYCHGRARKPAASRSAGGQEVSSPSASGRFPRPLPPC